MFQCHKVGCGMWNHEACLVESIENRTWEEFKKGMLTHEVQEVEEHKTLSQKIAGTVGHMVEKALHKDELKVEAASVTKSPVRSNKKAKTTSGGRKPWTGKLEGAITKIEKSSGEFIHRAIVRQLVPTSSSKATSSFVPKVWNMELSCLRCHQPLN